MLRDRVLEVMTSRVVTIGESSTVQEAAALMARTNIGSVIVVEGGKILGILTERDVLRRFLDGGIGGKRVLELMTRQVVSIAPETTLADAAGLMIGHGFRRLPVVEGSVLVGIVTATDLTYEMNSQHLKDRVSKYMSRVVYSVPLSATVIEAVESMVGHNIGCLLVLDGAEIAGIVTERDIVRGVVARGPRPKDDGVTEIMSTEVVRVEPDTLVSHACHLMYYYGVRRLPVVDGRGTVRGMITERDLLKAVKHGFETA